MLVHISVTDPGLRDRQQQIADELRVHGADVELGGIDDADPGPEDATGVHHADALLCLVGDDASLCGDGTHRGERVVEVARSFGIPVRAYETPATPTRPTDPIAGYGAARLERLRQELRAAGALATVPDTDGMVRRMRDDVEAIRATLRRLAPDAVRSLHRRLRAQVDARYDAFTVSMHNMDHIYLVDKIEPNWELPATFGGYEPGGAGANTIVGLNRLGVRTGVAGAVGDDTDGTALRRALERDQVATDLLLTVGDDVHTGHALVLRDRHGRHSNFIDAGANDRLVAELDRRGLRQPLADAVARSRILHQSPFSAMSARELQEQLLVNLPDETIVTFKPGTMEASLGAERLVDVLGRCDVLFASEQEIDLLTARLPRYDDRASLTDKLNRLFSWRHARGYATPMIVASMLVLDDDGQTQPPFLYWGTGHYEGGIGIDLQSSGQDAREVVDPAGARDATAAGVLFGLLRSRGPSDCANLAYVLAMSVAAEIGCRKGLPRPPQVRECWRRWLHVDDAPTWLDPYGA